MQQLMKITGKNYWKNLISDKEIRRLLCMGL